jgi:hypothetical protein
MKPYYKNFQSIKDNVVIFARVTVLVSKKKVGSRPLGLGPRSDVFSTDLLLDACPRWWDIPADFGFSAQTDASTCMYVWPKMDR